MKLNNYIQTKDIKDVHKFISLCKERNIKITVDDIDSNSKGYYVVGIFTRDTNTIDHITDIDFSVCVSDEEEPASWWNRIYDYESFIKNFDKNTYITFLNQKLDDIKTKYPQFQIGTEMISNIDLKYGFFNNPSKFGQWDPYILKSYYYSSVSDKFGPRTQKGFGDFSGFKVWNENLLLMNKKQIKRLLGNV